MTFQQILDRLIERVPESTAAVLTDKDGDPVVHRTIEVPNDALQLLGAYRNVLTRHLQQSIEEFDSGEIDAVAFSTDQHWVLMKGAAEQCTLVLVMHRDGYLGRARFEMDRAIEELNAEL